MRICFSDSPHVISVHLVLGSGISSGDEQCLEKFCVGMVDTGAAMVMVLCLVFYR